MVFSLLVLGVQPATAGGTYWQDGDYERICLTMGWTDCAVWKIVDRDGIEKNRVIGPGSLSILTQTCGSNFCGGGESATAIKLETLAPWVTPTTPSPTTPNTTSRIPYTQPCTGGSDRTPGLPQCLMPEGLGGSAWNLVDNNSGIVLNGAVCSEAVCGRNGEWRQWPADRKLNDRLWPTGFPEGATYIQTPFDGAYWGRYFTNGVYEVNGGGILQPGSKTIIWPVQTPPTPTVETRTVTSETSTSISTPPPVSDSVTTTSAPVVTPAPSSVVTPAPAPSPTPSSTPAPISAPAPTSETQSAVAPVVPIAPTSTSETDSGLDEVEAEEEIIDSIVAVVQSNGTTRIEVSTGYTLTAMTVVATKKGSKKKYTYRITTNADGDRKFKSGLNLRGYTVVLYKGSTELDRMYIS